VVTVGLISECDKEGETWKVSGVKVSRCSGFVLHNFPEHVVTAGHGLYRQVEGRKLFTAIRAWVIPVRGARAIPLKDQDSTSLDVALGVGAIPVREWRSLWPATLRRNMWENFRGQLLSTAEFIRDDIALLHLGQAIHDLQVPEPLQARPKRLRIPANARGRLGLLIGNPRFDLGQRILWPGYSTWGSLCSDKTRPHRIFNPTPAVQFVQGETSKGMSGGPVVANLRNHKGISLCWHND
jgi:hypothetical protein